MIERLDGRTSNTLELRELGGFAEIPNPGIPFIPFILLFLLSPGPQYRKLRKYVIYLLSL